MLIIDIEKANYKLHGRIDFQGIKISVENRKGSVRSGVDKDGHAWKTKMVHSYGRIVGVPRKGADKEHVDVFVGPDKQSENVFILHLNHADTGLFDEDKCYLGFRSKEEVKASFDKHYDGAGQKLFGGITGPMSIDTFKKRLTIQSTGIIKSLVEVFSGQRFALIDLEKAHIAAHTRHTKYGTSWVNSYDDKRSKEASPQRPQNPPPALLTYSSVDELREIFKKEYVDKEIKDPQGNRIIFEPRNFNHLSKIDTGTPGEFRCKRMLWIKDVIQSPDLIIQDEKDPSARLFLKFYKGEPYLFVAKIRKNKFVSVTAYPLESKSKLKAFLQSERLYSRPGVVIKSFAFLGEDLEKSHVKAHFRKDIKTGKMVFIPDYDDKRHTHILHVKFEKGDEVKIISGKHAGKVGVVGSYVSDHDRYNVKVPGEKALIGTTPSNLENKTNPPIVREHKPVILPDGVKRKPIKTSSSPINQTLVLITKGTDGLWRDATGTSLAPEHQARMKGVPPAWTDVHLNMNPEEPLQVKGVDARGKAQYLYSAKHSEESAVQKFERLKDFNKALPKIKKALAADIKDPSKADSAACLTLIYKTGFRVGSDADTYAKVKAYGASTLLAEHVTITGSRLDFKFVGKKGVEQAHSITDKALADFLQPKIAAGGKLFDTSDMKLRGYLKDISGKKFKVKDFRTWVATDKALEVIKAMKAPADDKEFKKAQIAVAKEVAAVLGNNYKMALDAYIDPSVFDEWNGNSLIKWMGGFPTAAEQEELKAALKAKGA